jgi:phosphoglycerate dehydrogenase-like enzyme
MPIRRGREHGSNSRFTRASMRRSNNGRVDARHHVPDMKLAILDDYQRVALKMADWSQVAKRCRIDVIDMPLRTVQEAVQTLAPYDIVCMLRERTAAPRELIEGLPNLKLLAISGPKHRTLDLQAATEHGVVVCNSPVPPETQFGTPELAIALMLASVRRIPQEERRLRDGHWQAGLGMQIYGRTLGILGLGGIGRNVARMAQGLNMQVIAWSHNLTTEAAATVGVRRVEREELFTQSDIVSLHLVLGDRTRGIVGARELSLMKPTAFIINTARGALIDEGALLEALQKRTIAGAALDVFWEEPLPKNHPLRQLDNVILTPHLGYVVEESYRAFYGGLVETVTAFLAGTPIRLSNPAVVPRASFITRAG